MVSRRHLLKLSALGTASFAAPLAYSASNITMTNNTGNPIGSTSPKDLSDNSRNLDYLCLGPAPAYADRKGVPRKSWAGMEGEFGEEQTARRSIFSKDQARRESEFAVRQEDREAQFDAFLDASGFEPPVPYAPGVKLIRTTQTVTWDKKEYRVKNEFLPLVTTSWESDESKLKLVGDDSLRQDIANSTDPAKGAGMNGYIYGSAHSEGREVGDKLRETRSILDFVPRSRKADMRDGISRWPATVALNYALRETAGGILIPPGCIVPIDGPIDLDRSNELVGGGPFDTAIGKGSKIFILDGSNCEAVRTPYAVNPVAGSQTHFMGLRNLVIDGNKTGQTREVQGGLVKFWGVFVGSWIDRVFIMNSYGTALDFRGGCDVDVSHLWIAGTATEKGYALDTNAELTDSMLGGLLQFDNLYVENTSIDKRFDAKANEAYRGKNIRLRRLVSAHIKDIHTEGAAVAIDLDQNHTVRIDKITGYNIGSNNEPESALVRHIGGMSRAVSIGTMQYASTTNSPYMVRKSIGLVANNAVPEIRNLASPFVTGYTSASDNTFAHSKQAAAAYSNRLSVERLGGYSEVSVNLTWGDADAAATQRSRFKERGLGPSISSSINRLDGTEKDFILCRSTGGTGDSLTLSDPMLVGSRPTALNVSSGMFYLADGLPGLGKGPVIQRISGSNGGADGVATVIRGNGPPTGGAEYIGQMYVDLASPPPRKVYMGTNFLGAASDWSLLN